jgi:hypothetical protein
MEQSFVTAQQARNFSGSFQQQAQQSQQEDASRW